MKRSDLIRKRGGRVRPHSAWRKTRLVSQSKNRRLLTSAEASGDKGIPGGQYSEETGDLRNAFSLCPRSRFHGFISPPILSRLGRMGKRQLFGGAGAFILATYLLGVGGVCAVDAYLSSRSILFGMLLLLSGLGILSLSGHLFFRWRRRWSASVSSIGNWVFGAIFGAVGVIYIALFVLGAIFE